MSKHQTCPNCHSDFVGSDLNINHNLCRDCDQMIHEDCHTQLNEAEERILELQAENAKLKETNQRLNRRCQLAESAADENIDKCKRAGVSFGRILANYSCTKLGKANDELRDENAKVKDCLAIQKTLNKTLTVENDRLIEQIQNLNNMHDRDEKRWQKALKEQGFKIGPFVEGPDIRD